MGLCMWENGIGGTREESITTGASFASFESWKLLFERWIGLLNTLLLFFFFLSYVMDMIGE